MNCEITKLMEDELIRRKAMYRDLFAGKPLDRLPVDVRVGITSPYSVQEQFSDGEKQIEAALANAMSTW